MSRRFLIVPLTTYERNGWASKELLEFMESVRWSDPGVTVGAGYAHNFTSASAARNFLFDMVKKMPKKERPDWLLMIDNDMAPPINLLKCVMKAPEDAGIIVPRFYMWDNNKATVVLCWGMDEKDAPMTKTGYQAFTVSPGSMYQLTKCGTGAMFVKPDILDDLEPPYFYYTYDQHGSRTSTEDINFCTKLRTTTKWKIYGNSDYEVGHYHNVDLAKLAKWLYSQELKKAEVEELSPTAECFR